MKNFLAAVVLFLLPFGASADFVGFAVGAAYWNPKPGGDISYKDLGENDFSDDLKLGDSKENILWLVIEHPVPVLPNIKLVKTSLELDGDNGTLRAQFGEVGAGVPGINTGLILDQIDVILYYEILDNWVNLDLGIDIRIFDGSTEVGGHGLSTREEVSATVPLLYGNARFDLPFTGFFAGLEASLLSVDDNRVTDMTASAGYESDIGLGAMIGLRRQSIVLEDTDVELDFTVSGPFAAVYFDF